MAVTNIVGMLLIAGIYYGAYKISVKTGVKEGGSRVWHTITGGSFIITMIIFLGDNANI